jgi:hypothetical protein
MELTKFYLPQFVYHPEVNSLHNLLQYFKPLYAQSSTLLQSDVNTLCGTLYQCFEQLQKNTMNYYS